MTRTFMVADLGNFYGKLECLPEAISEAQEHRSSWTTDFDKSTARAVAEDYAEKVFYDWDCPSEFDLIVWEGAEGDEPTGPLFRVKIEVKSAPIFDSSSAVAVSR